MTADGSSPLRVALLTPRFWPEVRRGGERFVRELADGLIAAGHRPRLITSHRAAPRRTVDGGLPVLRVPRPPLGPLGRHVEEFSSHAPLSWIALRAGRDDVAHAFHVPDALAAARWGRRTGRPAILSYLGIPRREWLSAQRRRQFLATAIRRCDAVVALSAFAAAEFWAELGYEPEVIHPPVDVDAFRPGGSRTPDPTFVCAADAGEPRKQVALAVAAIALVRDELPGARLVLSRPRDPTSAARAGVPATASGVEWRELDSLPALRDAYARAWASVLPAPGEAFGLVLAEALACGTPVVGYDDGGVPEVIDRPGVGVLFSHATPRALADAMLAAGDLAQRADTAERCRARALEFSRAECTRRYLDVYRRCGAGSG
jgi:glycosyltransferase involved in cell wall biosynthesis